MKKLNIEKEVLDMYEKLKSIDKTSKIFGCDPSTIRNILIRNNVERTGSCRIYNINESYFETIDRQEKAYILGFILADGCIYKNNTRLQINIHKKDKEIIYFIRDQIGDSLPIKNLEKENQVRLVVNSSKLCKDLNKLGILENKTKVVKFPSIDNDFLGSFVRGCFDGDGSFKYNSNKVPGLVFSYVSASKEFIQSLEVVLRENCKIQNRKLYVHKKSGAFYLEYAKKEDVKKISNFMYNNSTFHLNRKYEKTLNY